MKKSLILLTSALLFVSASIAQTSKNEAALIKETVTNYIEGTSYNEINRIRKAFYPEANLYLDGKEGELNVLPISEYIGFFKNRKPGEFNGRIGKIISINQFGNISQAKAEILIPAINKKYIDMFILKKIEGEWKIISKTANSEKSDSKGEKIIFVTSNAHFYGTSDIGTGNSFSEIVNAYDEFIKAGYTIDFISPKGGAIPLGYINTSNDLQKSYLYNSDFMYALENTKNPAEINSKNYKAIYFVGGGAAMFGVPENEDIQKIAMQIYEDNNGIISSICHGTAGIVNLKTKDGKYLFENKMVSGYPDDYEAKDKEYYKQFPLHIQESIEARGGNFKYSERNMPHIEVEDRLITGQNHLSSKLVAQKIIEKLKEKR